MNEPLVRGNGTVATLIGILVWLFVASIYALVFVVSLIGEFIVYYIEHRKAERAKAETIQSSEHYHGQHRKQ